MNTIREILQWIGGMTCIYFFVEFLKMIARHFDLDKKYRVFAHTRPRRNCDCENEGVEDE